MTIPKFDINEGVLLLGTDEELMAERGVSPSDVYDLASLLLNNAGIEIKPGVYPYLNIDEWKRDDYEIHAKWLLKLVTSVDPTITTPTEAVYERAFWLGIGPEPRRITRKFGPLWKFHDELGLKGGYCRGKYENWSTRDFVEYGKRVVSSLHGEKPSEEVFQRRFDKRTGPSPKLIRDRIGGIGKLQELIGFPFIADWTEEDFINYGVKVALANPGLKLTRDVFDELSKRKRGPSTRTIVNHFDKLTTYREIIAYETEFAKKRKEEWLETKLEEIDTMINDGTLPAKLAESVEMDENRVMVRRVAIYLLVENLFGEALTTRAKIGLSSVQPRNLIASIRSRNTALTAGDIEVTAAELGLFDDIWQAEDYVDDLKVEPKIDGRRNNGAKANASSTTRH